MFDMRAYVASLIAVFMALAIGILLGTVIQENSPLVDQIDAQIKSLQGDFASIREENRTLEDELEGARQIGESILPVLTSGKLLGKKVTLIKTGRVSNQVSATLLDALHEAGADVSELTVIKYGISSDIEEALQKYVVDNVVESATSDTTSSDDATGIPVVIDDDYLATVLASSLAGSGATPSIADLTKMGVINADTPIGTSTDAVILIVDPSKDAGVADSFLVPLSQAFNSVGIVAVVAETGQTNESIMPSFSVLGISTVDNIDDATGSISAVYALSGIIGSFGKKDGAESLLPLLEQ